MVGYLHTGKRVDTVQNTRSDQGHQFDNVYI